MTESRLDDEVNAGGLSSLSGSHDCLGMVEGEEGVLIAVHDQKWRAAQSSSRFHRCQRGWLGPASRCNPSAHEGANRPPARGSFNGPVQSAHHSCPAVEPESWTTDSHNGINSAIKSRSPERNSRTHREPDQHHAVVALSRPSHRSRGVERFVLAQGRGARRPAMPA